MQKEKRKKRSRPDLSFLTLYFHFSGGDTLSSLKEIITANIAPTDRIVSLLSHLKDCVRYIEIAIKQCRNGGIDCKIHGLHVVGRKRCEEDEFASTVSFLASDSEEWEDTSKSRWSLDVKVNRYGFKLDISSKNF